ncbi:hypothetical protein GQ43DRAFT_475347 [Delitschia confertaspora ATCC 74209]|uniref:F-box domain-containing protein n=1 Tax=Delitschia confertaspora ATCC 74209 TaxID=1513339 RepID=A0A9P4MLV1_9PLEO|nr:hypothetical protein GQ43DRAFT_475347 [Delitschia confertaspora ATCC 74209]
MTTARQKAASCPSLPLEVWIHVLEHYDDLNHLWSTCRHVSAGWKLYIEQIFAQRHLQGTKIVYQLEKNNLGGKSRRPEMHMTFSHFSPDDKTLAHFKAEVHEGSKSSVIRSLTTKTVWERWVDQVRSSRPENPRYTIQIERMVNDTELPRVMVNLGAREISFDWRGMFQAFFREEERFRVLCEREIENCTLQPENGNLRGLFSEVPQETIFRSQRRELQKRIRRERLKEHYEGDEEMTWALNALDIITNDTTSRSMQQTLEDDVPGARIGERFHDWCHLPQSLYMDEWSSFNWVERHAFQLAVEREKSKKTEFEKRMYTSRVTRASSRRSAGSQTAQE